jgi:FAD/FMN-containing dehydrogenase
LTALVGVTAMGRLMEDELGIGMSVVRRLKKTLDPSNILSSGKSLG